MSVFFRTGYMDDALFELPMILDRAEAELTDPEFPEFDTIVGTGFSGGVVIPALALRLGKKFLLIRKDSDDSHHSGKMIGEIDRRWIFVDDFTETGTTRSRVIDKVSEIEDLDAFVRGPDGLYPLTAPKLQTVLVGSYYYQQYDVERRIDTTTVWLGG